MRCARSTSAMAVRADIRKHCFLPCPPLDYGGDGLAGACRGPDVREDDRFDRWVRNLSKGATMSRSRRNIVALMATGLVAVSLTSCDKKNSATKASGHQINNAALWDGAVWFARTEGDVSKGGGASAKTWMIRAPAGPNQSEEQLAALDAVEPWFLAGTDRLSILWSGSVDYYEDGKVETHKLPVPLEKVSRPFLYQGRPAVLACEALDYSLKVWEDEKWQVKEELQMEVPVENDGYFDEYLQAFESEGVVRVFCQVPLKTPVYYHRGLPLADGAQNWQQVAEAGGAWKTGCLDKKPAIFFHTKGNGPIVLGKITREGGWEDFFSRSIGWDIGLGICPTGKGEDFILLRRILPLGMKILAIENGQPVWAYEGHGKTNAIEKLVQWTIGGLRPGAGCPYDDHQMRACLAIASGEGGWVVIRQCARRPGRA